MRKKRSFWKWLILWARAGTMEEARKKRIMRENLEEWNRMNRDFIREEERKDARRIDRLGNTEDYDDGCDYGVGYYNDGDLPNFF